MNEYETRHSRLRDEIVLLQNDKDYLTNQISVLQQRV